VSAFRSGEELRQQQRGLADRLVVVDHAVLGEVLVDRRDKAAVQAWLSFARP
jgi:hypothetical protein